MTLQSLNCNVICESGTWPRVHHLKSLPAAVVSSAGRGGTKWRWYGELDRVRREGLEVVQIVAKANMRINMSMRLFSIRSDILHVPRLTLWEGKVRDFPYFTFPAADRLQHVLNNAVDVIALPAREGRCRCSPS